jgi:hypothetical protein
MGVSENSRTVSDEKLRAATGRGETDWFALLDAAGATSLNHTQIARWLAHEFPNLDGWWCQAVTIRYEQARGMRLPGQRADGTFSTAATRIVPGSPGEVLEAAIAHGAAWLGAPPSSTNPTAKTPTARWKLDGKQQVVATATTLPDGRVSVAFTWSGIPDEDGVSRAKEAIREQIALFAS